MGIGGNWESFNGKKWEWDLSFRLKWDGNGNEVIEMGGILYKKKICSHTSLVRTVGLFPLLISGYNRSK